jgi:hypothetical protein
MGRPAVAQQLHGLGIVDFLVEILNQSGPLQWVSYTALLQPGSTGGAMWCMKEMIAGLLASGTDITPVLVSTGYADMLVSALKAIEQVGVEEVSDTMAIYGILQAIVAINDGRCLPQIEDKLRTATSALRFCIDSGDQISLCVSPCHYVDRSPDLAFVPAGLRNSI